MTTKRTMWFVVSLVLLAAALLVTLLWRSGAGEETAEIGSILILSGEFSSYGEQFREGAALAEDVLSRGDQGPQVRVRFVDSQGQKALAVELLRRLREQNGIRYLADVMGTGLALEAAPVANQLEVLVLSGVNTGPELTRKGGPLFYRIIPSDGVAAQQLVAWARDLGVAQAAIVHDVDEWATGLLGELEASLQESEIEVVQRADCSRGFQLFGPVVEKVRTAAPEVVFLLLYPREAGLFLREASRQGLDAVFLGTDNFTGAELVEHAGGAATGVRFVVPGEQGGPTAAYDRFLAEYQSRYGADRLPELFTTTGYDVVSILADLMNRFGDDTIAAAEYLQTAEYEGASGKIRFDENGDLSVRAYRRMIFEEGENGEIKAVEATALSE